MSNNTEYPGEQISEELVEFYLSEGYDITEAVRAASNPGRIKKGVALATSTLALVATLAAGGMGCGKRHVKGYSTTTPATHVHVAQPDEDVAPTMPDLPPASDDDRPTGTRDVDLPPPIDDDPTPTEPRYNSKDNGRGTGNAKKSNEQEGVLGSKGPNTCLETRMQFGFDSSDVSKKSASTVKSFLDEAKSAGLTKAQAMGTASIENKGDKSNNDAPYNDWLAKQRASAVKKLGDNSGVEITPLSIAETEALDAKHLSPNRTVILTACPDGVEMYNDLDPLNGERNVSWINDLRKHSPGQIYWRGEAGNDADDAKPAVTKVDVSEITLAEEEPEVKKKAEKKKSAVKKKNRPKKTPARDPEDDNPHTAYQRPEEPEANEPTGMDYRTFENMYRSTEGNVEQLKKDATELDNLSSMVATDCGLDRTTNMLCSTEKYGKFCTGGNPMIPNADGKTACGKAYEKLGEGVNESREKIDQYRGEAANLRDSAEQSGYGYSVDEDIALLEDTIKDIEDCLELISTSTFTYTGKKSLPEKELHLVR
jgi:hypothetical protein